MEDAADKTAVYVVLGATASGKSAVALELAGPTGAEIISADSMQVYRGMDIGTAKPTPQQRARVPHHLIDTREAWESFSTAEYIELADRAIGEIAARGSRPLLVGGTALYVKSLLAGIFDGPSADWDFRRRLRDEAREVGSVALHRRLAALDPAAAAGIHPNDLRRIERALEIHEKTGRPPSELRREWSSDDLRYDAAVVGLALARDLLHERIDERVDRMMAAGWMGEVRRLITQPLGMGREASQALGYKELAAVVRGESEEGEAVDKIKARTRQFAKRQMTWFRGFGDLVRWVEVAPGDDTAATAGKVMAAFGFKG